jgi:hypothetical protein
MRHLRLFTAVIAVFCFLITGCKKDFRTESTISADDLQHKTLAKSSVQLSAELKAQLSKLRSSLPAGYEKRAIQNSHLLLKIHPEYRNMVNRALKAITPTPCDANTPLFQWIGQELADWDSNIIYFAIVTGMLDFPTYDALLFENSSANQYFGLHGEYTHNVTKTFKDLKRFWNIETDNMVVVAMHGSMLRNRDKIIRIDKILFGDDQATAEFYADLILSLLQQVPQYRNGDHPVFTFNAFSQPSFDFPPFGPIPPKIVMGDGILAGFGALGYEDVAPQAILAHEFGHQIQFQLGIFDESVPENTRRMELMADAFSAYFLSHARGASMQWKRVKQFLQVFFSIGDCSFTSNDHHGTPTQRMAAAEWAYNLANDAQKQGQILTSQTFVSLFEAQLPELITH